MIEGVWGVATLGVGWGAGVFMRERQRRKRMAHRLDGLRGREAAASRRPESVPRRLEGSVAETLAIALGSSRRASELTRSLVPMLEQAACLVEMGMSVESAIGSVVRDHPERHRALKAEWFRYLQELRLGHSRSQALIALADRCGIPEARRLSGTLMASAEEGPRLAIELTACVEALQAEHRAWQRRRARHVALLVAVVALSCFGPLAAIALVGS